ncbi:hypothetical protein VNO80_15340 [Phaseolus coccineus]|uniref:Uncharacterized protein n=1 Tax=Phaseolus coccineus TaxID=3886 RepID=A0AAN9R2V9_PHACN
MTKDRNLEETEDQIRMRVPPSVEAALTFSSLLFLAVVNINYQLLKGSKSAQSLPAKTIIFHNKVLEGKGKTGDPRIHFLFEQPILGINSGPKW